MAPLMVHDHLRRGAAVPCISPRPCSDAATHDSLLLPAHISLLMLSLRVLRIANRCAELPGSPVVPVMHLAQPRRPSAATWPTLPPELP